MNHFYFDESIHDQRGGFILGAYVYGRDAEADVIGALKVCGLLPDVDEFKSCARMSECPEQVALRAALRGVLRKYRVGVLVMPADHRSSLGKEALLGLDQIARSNLLTAGFVASFDQGVFPSANQAAQLVARRQEPLHDELPGETRCARHRYDHEARSSRHCRYVFASRARS